MTGQASGRYNVLGELRDGPASRAYRARELESSDEVAVHVWPRDTVPRAVLVSLQSRFAELATLEHPRLLRSRALRTDTDNTVFECDYVAGETLERALAREPQLPRERALAIAEDIFDALVALHSSGHTHGALRPSTVWMERNGRVRLLGAGVGALISAHASGDDFYGVFDRLVPATTERLPQRDVFAAAALLFHMLEGRTPYDGASVGEMLARIRRERWPQTIGDAVNRLFAHLSPWSDDDSRPDAATVLALIRAARTEAEQCAPAPDTTASLLDEAPEPASLQPSRREAFKHKAREVARRVYAIVTGSGWPTLAAAAAAALMALLLAGPFLGRTPWWLEARRTAQALPAALPLPPASSAPASARTNDPGPAAEPAPLSAWQRTREEIVALAEIGDYPAALALLRDSKAAADELSEERNAIFARAEARFREASERTRRLATLGLLEEANREWNQLEPHWPAFEMRSRAVREQEILLELAAAADTVQRNADGQRTRSNLKADFERLVTRCLVRDDGTVSELLQAISALRAGASSVAWEEMRQDAEALAQIVQAEPELITATAAALRRKAKTLPIETFTTRFGAGVVAEFGTAALIVRRNDGTRDSLPLSRLTPRERYDLVSTVHDSPEGIHSLAMSILALRARVFDAARTHLWKTDGINDLIRANRIVRRAVEEATR